MPSRTIGFLPRRRFETLWWQLRDLTLWAWSSNASCTGHCWDRGDRFQKWLERGHQQHLKKVLKSFTVKALVVWICLARVLTCVIGRPWETYSNLLVPDRTLLKSLYRSLTATSRLETQHLRILRLWPHLQPARPIRILRQMNANMKLIWLKLRPGVL